MENTASSAETTLVAKRFSAAAEQYDQHANLQHDVGKVLTGMIPGRHYQTVIDLGVGTGHNLSELAPRSQQLLAIDLAWGMLTHTRARYSDTTALATPPAYLCGDGRQLPLQDNSVDLLFSSLVLQWCGDLETTLNEWRRVVKPGGHLVVSTVLEGSLWQLKQAWRAVDDHQHVNHFVNQAELDNAINRCYLDRKMRVVRPHTHWFDTLPGALASLRGIGANAVTAKGRRGLLGKHAYQCLQQAFEKYRSELGVPMTYQIGYMVLAK